ncbi:MAG: hypothetical protein ACJ71G_07450 [Nitrososphaeraceae archaeon]
MQHRICCCSIIKLSPYSRKRLINSKLWPKAPNILSRQINEVKTNLREIGIAIDNSARDPKTNTKTIQIRKISSTSLESLADENHAQVTSDTPKDNINNHNDKSLDDNEISLGKTPQIHAQNSQANDTNDSNDTLQLLRNQQASDTSYPSDKKKILAEFIEENGIDDVIDEMLSGI